MNPLLFLSAWKNLGRQFEVKVRRSVNAGLAIDDWAFNPEESGDADSVAFAGALRGEQLPRRWARRLSASASREIGAMQREYVAHSKRLVAMFYAWTDAIEPTFSAFPTSVLELLTERSAFLNAGGTDARAFLAALETRPRAVYPRPRSSASADNADADADADADDVRPIETRERANSEAWYRADHGTRDGQGGELWWQLRRHTSHSRAENALVGKCFARTSDDEGGGNGGGLPNEEVLDTMAGIVTMLYVSTLQTTGAHRTLAYSGQGVAGGGPDNTCVEPTTVNSLNLRSARPGVDVGVARHLRQLTRVGDTTPPLPVFLSLSKQQSVAESFAGEFLLRLWVPANTRYVPIPMNMEPNEGVLLPQCRLELFRPPTTIRLSAGEGGKGWKDLPARRVQMLDVLVWPTHVVPPPFPPALSPTSSLALPLSLSLPLPSLLGERFCPELLLSDVRIDVRGKEQLIDVPDAAMLNRRLGFISRTLELHLPRTGDGERDENAPADAVRTVTAADSRLGFAIGELTSFVQAFYAERVPQAEHAELLRAVRSRFPRFSADNLTLRGDALGNDTRFVGLAAWPPRQRRRPPPTRIADVKRGTACAYSVSMDKHGDYIG
jgi:hypothetical protein